jgi:hypothetical protein
LHGGPWGRDELLIVGCFEKRGLGPIPNFRINLFLLCARGFAHRLARNRTSSRHI